MQPDPETPTLTGRRRQGRQQLDQHEPGRRADPGQARRHLAPPGPGDPVSAFINVRVADIASFHREATAKGAQFLTEPLDRKAELRCYLRDPDGYLVEVGQATGMLEGVFADPPAGNQR
jgi:catechol 2,3-dioxygenase-like lactoylglutathione lyase family enzyme